MNPKATKLAKAMGLTLDLAETLVAAGYGSPGSIRRATLLDLQKVTGVGRATARKLKRNA